MIAFSPRRYWIKIDKNEPLQSMMLLEFLADNKLNLMNYKLENTPLGIYCRMDDEADVEMCIDYINSNS